MSIIYISVITNCKIQASRIRSGAARGQPALRPGFQAVIQNRDSLDTIPA